MSDSTDRVLASIDEVIDGYVSEDWTVGDDAMRWRPEEPERLTPAWADFAYLPEHVIVRPPDVANEWHTSWGGGYPVLEVVDEFQRLLFDRLYSQPTWISTADVDTSMLDLSWCNWSAPEETPDVEPHWDDSLVASMDRTRQGEPEPAVFGPSPVVIARTTEAIEEALRSQAKPEPEPLAVNWKVDAGRVSRKHRNRR